MLMVEIVLPSSVMTSANGKEACRWRVISSVFSILRRPSFVKMVILGLFGCFSDVVPKFRKAADLHSIIADLIALGADGLHPIICSIVDKSDAGKNHV